MSGDGFGAMVRRLRVERGISQNELARRGGVDPAYINRIERAGELTANGAKIKRSLPGRGLILAIAAALDMSYAERDRLLYCAGLAPETDWQIRCEDAEAAIMTVREAVGTLSAAVEPTLIRRQVS